MPIKKTCLLEVGMSVFIIRVSRHGMVGYIYQTVARQYSSRTRCKRSVRVGAGCTALGADADMSEQAGEPLTVAYKLPTLPGGSPLRTRLTDTATKFEMTTTQAHKDWVSFLRNQIGGEFAVTKYDDDERTTSIPIYSSQTEGGLVGATVGLMDLDQSRNPAVQIRTEILIDTRMDDARGLNLLSTIAFYIIKNQWRVSPGTVFEEIGGMYFPGTALRHIYFTAPYQWDGMSKVVLSDRTIFPLIAIPISTAEANLASQDAGNALESLWDANRVDVLDWNRKSSV
ncbi:suppressor of fused domain protein [Massilia sp. CCM 8692]|uniref:Suppressor of fused domain protein n=2 Tax=Massilia rubra TaxID=2607910 RepID=A0ABX0LSR1_9BURK|nr:suppressor of fused domain protein [Massilia rubra]